MTLNDRFAFERLQQRIDDPQNDAVVVVIVGKDRSVDTAAAGISTDIEMFWILHHVLTELASDIIPTFSEADKARAAIVYPTAEEARSLGLLRAVRRDDN